MASPITEASLTPLVLRLWLFELLAQSFLLGPLRSGNLVPKPEAIRRMFGEEPFTQWRDSAKTLGELFTALMGFFKDLWVPAGSPLSKNHAGTRDLHSLKSLSLPPPRCPARSKIAQCRAPSPRPKAQGAFASFRAAGAAMARRSNRWVEL